MALSRLALAFSLLLLSLLVIASAGDYGDASSKYGFDGIPADSPQAKPEGEEKPRYGTKPDYYKPKPVDKEKPDYGKKPEVVKSKPEGEEKPNYGTKEEEKENRLSIAVQGVVLCKSGSKYYPIQGKVYLDKCFPNNPFCK